MELVVSTEWLANEIGASDLRVVDATWFMPDAGRNAQAEYEGGHIPGAVFMDLQELADANSSLPNILPPPEKFASRMQSLGLGDGSQAVLSGGAQAGQRIFTGTVTKLHDNFGFIDDEVFFQTSICKGSNPRYRT